MTDPATPAIQPVWDLGTMFDYVCRFYGATGNTVYCIMDDAAFSNMRLLITGLELLSKSMYFSTMLTGTRCITYTVSGAGPSHGQAYLQSML